MKRTLLTAILVLGLASMASVALAVTYVTSYRCPSCQRVEQYAERGYRTHYCTGTKEKPHSKTIMERAGESEVK